MLLPLMGLFMVFIPAGGFLLALLLLFFKRFRFLSLFAAIMPCAVSYLAMAGFWASSILLENLGVHSKVIFLAGLVLCTGAGALFGLLIGFAVAMFLLHVAAHFTHKEKH